MPRTARDQASVRWSVVRGTPWGEESWTEATAGPGICASTPLPTSQGGEKVECPLFPKKVPPPKVDDCTLYWWEKTNVPAAPPPGYPPPPKEAWYNVISKYPPGSTNIHQGWEDRWRHPTWAEILDTPGWAKAGPKDTAWLDFHIIAASSQDAKCKPKCTYSWCEVQGRQEFKRLGGGNVDLPGSTLIFSSPKCYGYGTPIPTH